MLLNSFLFVPLFFKSLEVKSVPRSLEIFFGNLPSSFRSVKEILVDLGLIGQVFVVEVQINDIIDVWVIEIALRMPADDFSL